MAAPSTSSNSRRIREELDVPRIDAETLALVFGRDPIDPDVEWVVLYFEYWHKAAPNTPRLVLERLLEALTERNITRKNLGKLIALLAAKRLAQAFFDLIASNIDRDRKFREFLLSRGVSLETVRTYASFDGINPKLFFEGFVYGVAESAATLVVDLLKVARFVAEIPGEVLMADIRFTQNPRAEIAHLAGQIQLVRQVAKELWSKLKISEVPAELAHVWQDWNKRFETHLQNLEPFEAGRTLGRIAGDLWQMLTAILGLIKLARIAGTLAIRFAPLVLGSLRQAAAEAATLLTKLSELLMIIGKSVLDGLGRLGLASLEALFPPAVVEQILLQGKGMVQWLDFSLIRIDGLAYATAFNSPAREPFKVLVSQGGKPLFMAAMSESIPGRAGDLLANVGVTTAEAERFVDRVFEGLAKGKEPPKSAFSPSKAAMKAAQLELLAQRLDTQLAVLIKQEARDLFRELRKQGVKIEPHRFGTALHARVAPRAVALIAEMAPELKVFPERSVRTVFKELALANPKLNSKALTRLLDTPVSQWLTTRPDLLKLLGMEESLAKEGAAATRKAIEERFGWNAKTLVGDLQSDLIGVDDVGGRLFNIDWSSSTKLQKFEQTLSQLARDLGEDFKGGWDELGEAYGKDRKIFDQMTGAYRDIAKSEIPAEVKENLDALRAHALRETIIRREIFQALFPKWNISSYEMLYDGIAKLFKSK